MQKVYIVFVDGLPNTATVFLQKENAIKYIEQRWHDLMRFFQFSKFEAKNASDGYGKSKHMAYSARDIDGHIHSASILETIVYDQV